MAIVTLLRDLDLDLGVLAVKSLFQRDLHVVAQIGAAARPALGAAAEGLAEDGLEDIADIAEALLASTAAHALLEGFHAVAVVGRALLRVLEAIVGDADRLELGLAVRAAWIAIRVMLHRKLAIGGFDGAAVRIARDEMKAAS